MTALTRFFVLSFFLNCLSVSTQAQIVVTEYFVMKKDFKIDLSSPAAAKKYYIKGVLDINFDMSRLELAVCYNPKLVSVYKAMQHILTQTVGEDTRMRKENGVLNRAATVSKSGQ